MNNILKIFRLLIDEKTDMFKGKTNYKVALKSFVKLLLSIVVTTIICIVFVRKVTIVGIKMNIEMLSIILLVTQLIAFFMSLGTIISNLYLSKDTELLMCMPATHNQIFIAKLITIYITDFVSNLLYFSPIFVTFAVTSTISIPFIYYILLPLFLLILPIVPMVIAALISIPTMIIIKFLKKHMWIFISTILVLISILIYFYMDFVGNIVTTISFVENQIYTANKINGGLSDFAGKNYIYMWIANAMIGKNIIIVLPLMIIAGIVCIYLMTLLVRPFYFKTAMAQSESSSTKSINTKCRIRNNSILSSLLKKETLMVFRTPGYIFQYFIFALLMPLIILVYDKLLIAVTVSKAGKVMIAGAHILVLSILTMLSCTISASAISREGGNYYIMKIAPVEYKKQAFVKILFNIIIIIISIFVTTVFSLVFVKLNSYYIIMSSLIVLFASIGQICFNFDLDLRNPKLDWFDSGEITSLSKNIVYSMIVGLIVSFVLAYLVFLFINIPSIWIILTVISILYAVARLYLLRVRINYYFKINEI